MLTVLNSQCFVFKFPVKQVDFHCWMCGKNCNSEKQWQGHISSEKHKEKVFHTEDDQNCWQYRFPTGYFSICDRYVVFQRSKMLKNDSS